MSHDVFLKYFKRVISENNIQIYFSIGSAYIYFIWWR